nr:EOG090X06K9 [Ilyocryptus agilis]
MKYKKLAFIGILCLISWLALIFIVFNENTATDQNKKGGNKYEKLAEYVRELENKINHQKEAYKILSDKFQELREHPEKAAGKPLETLNNVFKEFGLLDAPPVNEGKKQVPIVPEGRHAKESEIVFSKETILPIIVFSCNRPEIRRCLDGLLKYRPNAEKFPIIVSQDCGHGATAETISSYGSQITHIQQPDQSEPEVPPNENKFRGYFKIARHYLWGLKQIFRSRNHTAVIIVEDDLDIAPDFYSYFSATYDLLSKDPTLWCVSAWNDNGKASMVDVNNGSRLLYRSDFFPGLGWMITRDLWDELEPKWPKSYWDDWMRRPEQRKDRACIRPEISRTRTFGKIGVSNGLFFDKHLKYIKLNEDAVDFSRINVSYLLQPVYDEQYINLVYSLPVVTVNDVRTNNLRFDGPVRITYHTKDVFKNAAKLLGLMDDFKSGVPRTGYHGIVAFFYNGRRVFLSPNSNWKGYDLTWS